MLWEIWMEGYAATGNIQDATYIGKVDAPTFDAACRLKFQNDSDFKDGPVPSVWGCRLFDNEVDARKTFG